MPVDLLLRQRYVSVLRHEFGHWIAARTFGFPGGGIVFKGNDAGSAVDLLPSIKTLSDAREFIEARIVILLSGALAEALDNKGRIDNPKAHALLKSTAANDHAKVREIVRLLTGIGFPDASEAEFGDRLKDVDQKLYSRASALVHKHAQLIIDLAVFGMKRLDTAVDNGVGLDDVELTSDELNKFPDLATRLAAPKK